MVRYQFINSLIVFMFMMFSAGAFCSPPQNDFAANNSGMGRHWLTIVDSLLRSGVTRVGDLELSEFRKAGLKAKWKPLIGNPSSVESGSRQSAYYHDGNLSIFIAKNPQAEALGSLATLELHEVMRFNRYYDSDYSLSTALTILSEMPNGPERNTMLKAYANRYFKQIEMSGDGDGGTGVSGGGDLPTLFIKMEILHLLKKRNSNVALDFLTNYPAFDFEPLQNMNLNKVYIEYKYLPRANVHGRQEFFSIYIPMQRWKMGAEARQVLMDETAEKISSIFPATSGQKLRSFRPEECKEDQQIVSYPDTNDPAIMNIQSFRGSVLLGCKKMLEHQVFAGLIAPAIPYGESPEQAGNTYFNCSFHYRNSSSLNVNAVPFGQSMSISDQWGLLEDDYLSGELAVSKNGDLLSTGIIYRAPNSQNYTVHTETQAVAADHGSTKVWINNEPLLFECKKAL